MNVASAASHGPAPPALARWLGTVDYETTWRAMRGWVDQRETGRADELWLLEHPPVFTLGQSGRREHLLAPGDIPVLAVDRGGQVTYHGPGQLVVYVLIDLNRLGIGVRALVSGLESAVIGLAREWGIAAHARREAPGVYVNGAKLASIGLRIRRGVSYHGLALNVDMDLGPFSRINPCGYPGLETVDLKRLGWAATVAATGRALLPHLWRALALAGDPKFAD